ncbi:FAD-binding protein, partial [Klebsiella pneumoniae]|uniref:FAD-binding protein n=1 Tax=Klebsiella pneumoniae TaxID=573 RepID=UPI003B97E626
MVLAAGGFPHDAARRRQLFPRDASGHDTLALPPKGCSGDGLRLGEAAGGVVATDLQSLLAWAPVSQVPHGDGTVGHFPHIIERG